MPSTPRSIPPEKSLADRRQRVRQGAFEAIANLDTHLVLVGSDQEQYTVILLRFAQFQLRNSWLA
jgi:hypothetical protein